MKIATRQPAAPTGALTAPKKARRSAKKRDPAFARATLLRVARAHFVSRGLAGARIDQIAGDSGYSKAMIYHYFGGKDKLYREVLDEAYEQFVARLYREIREPDPVRALRIFVQDAAAAARENPDVINLLSIENLHQAAHLKQSQRVRNLYPPVLAQLEGILRAGELSGAFRPSIDARHLYLSLASMLVHMISNRYTLSVSLGMDVSAEPFASAQVQQTIDMVVEFCSGFGAPGGKDAKSTGIAARR